MSTPLQRSGRVLVIDDEPSLCRLLVRCLRARHEVQAVEGGELAIELLERDPDYDVILCDVMMPVSGETVFRSATAAHPELADRFVFLSGAAFAPEARAFLDGLPNLRLDKPFDVADLLRLVQELIEERARRT
jgi:two-component system, cell cycle sensor histidine kinase and response regulator CckA